VSLLESSGLSPTGVSSKTPLRIPISCKITKNRAEMVLNQKNKPPFGIRQTKN
jgi:hypothetical protein